jgi:heptosyltransferase III
MSGRPRFCYPPRMRAGRLIERYVKRAFFGALAGWAGRARPLPAPEELARVRRVLLVRPNFRLGNLVLVTPALGVLRRALPDARIDVLCGAPYAELFACDPAVGETIPVPRDLHRRPRDLARLVRRLRATRYHLVLDGARGSSFLGALFAGLSRGTMRVASETSRYRAFFNVHVPFTPQSSHKVDMLLGLLSGLGLDVGDAAPYVTLGDDERRRAREVWRSLGLDAHAHVVGIVLGARGDKQWPLAQVVELVRGLHEGHDARVVLFGGPEEQERLREVGRALPPDVAIAPLVALRVFGALLARCSAVVTSDSGPMHLAAAVGAPTVTLVRAAQSAFYLPRDPKHVTLRRRDGVTAASVLEAVQAILARPVPAQAP